MPFPRAIVAAVDLPQRADVVHPVVPHTTGRSYQNFPDPELTDWPNAYYGANLDRLKRVKANWDPEDVFSYPQGIPQR